MARVKGGYQLRDLGSTNGTKLNGKARDAVDLFDGAPVEIGDVVFDFTLTPEEQADLAKEGPTESPIIKEEEAEISEDEASRRKSEAPRRSSPESKAPVVVSHPSGAASFLMTLAFLILAAGSFFVGMGIRYSKETGRQSLLQDMKTGVPEQPDPNDVELPEIGSPAEQIE